MGTSRRRALPEGFCIRLVPGKDRRIPAIARGGEEGILYWTLRCPFPNRWCDKQAYIGQLFFSRKNKYTNDGKTRLISNRSYPEKRSFNDLINRRDCKYYLPGYTYFTFGKFIDTIRRAGRGTLVGCFDIKDAYKQCKIRHNDRWQQEYRVGGRYFVDLGAMFGSRNAGDSWNLTMEFIVQAMKQHTGMNNGTTTWAMQFTSIHRMEDKTTRG